MKFHLWFCRRESEVHKKSSAFVIKFQIAIPQQLFIASRASKYMLEGKSEIMSYYAEVTSKRTNLSPFTKDYRGAAS